MFADKFSLGEIVQQLWNEFIALNPLAVYFPFIFNLTAATVIRNTIRFIYFFHSIVDGCFALSHVETNGIEQYWWVWWWRRVLVGKSHWKSASCGSNKIFLYLLSMWTWKQLLLDQFIVSKMSLAANKDQRSCRLVTHTMI